MTFDTFSPQCLRDAIEIELQKNDNPKIAAMIAIQNLKENPDYYNSFGILSKAKKNIAKLVKKVITNKKGKQQTVYVKVSQDEEKESIFNKIISFFGVPDKKRAILKLDVDYRNNNIQKKYNIDFSAWKNHVLSYFQNKEKWDNFFEGKREKRPVQDKEKKETKPKKKKSTVSNKGINLSVMRELHALYGKKPEVAQPIQVTPVQPAQPIAQENNFDTMPETESENKPKIIKKGNGAKIKTGLKTSPKQVEQIVESDIENLREGYFNEKPAEILNIGKDVFGARRHNFTTYQTMDVDVSQLEQDGVAQAYVTKKNLLGEYGLANKDERVAKGETEYKVLASFCVREYLKKMPENSPENRKKYMQFSRAIQRLDDESSDAKTYLQGLSEQYELSFSSEVTNKDSENVIGLPLAVFFETLNSGTRSKRYYSLDKKDRNALSNLTSILASETGTDYYKKTYDRIKEDILGATKAAGLKVKKGDVFIVTPEDKENISITVRDYLTDDDAKEASQARMKLSQMYGITIPNRFDEIPDNDKKRFSERAIKFFGKEFNSMQEYQKIREDFKSEQSKIIEQKTITTKLYPENNGQVVKAGKDKIEVSFKFPDDRIRTFSFDPKKIKSENIENVKRSAETRGSFKPNLYIESKVDRIGGKDFSSLSPIEVQKQLSQNFQTKALQYGNSMTDDERQYHSQWTLQSFSDLSEILNLPIEQITVNGKLGMAFGARGHSGALAHYEPETKMINLTRCNGFGSLAHEWGHFLDNVLSSDMGSFITSTPFKYESKTVDKTNIKHGSVFETRGSRRGTTARYFYDENAKNPDYPFAKLDKGENLPKKDSEYVGFNSFSRGGSILVEEPINKPFTEKAMQIASKLQKNFREKCQEKADSMEDGIEKFLFVDTFMNGHYWGSAEECWARGFESYIADKLAENGRKNTYLSSQGKTKLNDGQVAYPQGDFRKEMNIMFDEFFDMIRGSEDLKKAIVRYERFISDNGKKVYKKIANE